LLLSRSAPANLLTRARAEADVLRENARREAENKAKEIELSARQQQLKEKERIERESDSSGANSRNMIRAWPSAKIPLDRKIDTLSVKERHLDDTDAKLQRREKELAAREWT